MNILKRLRQRAHEIPPVPAAVWSNPLYFIGFGLGTGAIPIAPGTFGTLMAIPFYLVLQHFTFTAYLVFTVCFIAFSVWLCDYLSRQIHEHDHPGMCIDEFAGFFVTMINAPRGFIWILLGFALFRLFDIWKPWPIGMIDRRVHGGFGMVLDDVIAGIFAFIVIQIIANASLINLAASA